MSWHSLARICSQPLAAAWPFKGSRVYIKSSSVVYHAEQQGTIIQIDQNVSDFKIPDHGRQPHVEWVRAVLSQFISPQSEPERQRRSTKFGHLEIPRFAYNSSGFEILVDHIHPCENLKNLHLAENNESIQWLLLKTMPGMYYVSDGDSGWWRELACIGWSLRIASSTRRGDYCCPDSGTIKQPTRRTGSSFSVAMLSRPSSQIINFRSDPARKSLGGYQFAVLELLRKAKSGPLLRVSHGPSLWLCKNTKCGFWTFKIVWIVA